VITVIGFVLAAAVGSLARAEAGRRWNRPAGWSGGTLLVNIVGSFLLGLLHDVDPPLSTVLAVGGIGAFTTFSSFTRDAVALVEQRRSALAFGYVLATAATSIAAAALGIALT
jgi:CrcB protein